MAQHRVGDRPRRIVEIDVDALGAGARDRRVEVLLRLVVDGGVVAEQLEAILRLGRTAGDAHRATALDLRDLPHRRADAARRGRDQYGIPFPGLADAEQPPIGGDAVQPQRAQRQRQRQVGLAHLARHLAAIRQGVVLPAEHAGDDFAGAIFRMLRFDDFSHREGAHHRADLDRLGVVRRGVDPATHRRIDRQEAVAHHELAAIGRRHRPLRQLEMFGLRNADRPRLQPDLTIDLVAHLLPSPFASFWPCACLQCRRIDLFNPDRRKSIMTGL